MRRVSKAKAAALGEQVASPSPPKRKTAKQVSYDESEPDLDNPSLEETEVAVSKSPLPSGSKNGTNSSKEQCGEESDEEESYEVELVLDSRMRHGKRQFKIRWKGYGPADDTWEDEENVDAPELISSFLGEDKSVVKSPKKYVSMKANFKLPTKRSSTGKSPQKGAKKPKADGTDDENAEWEVSKIVDFVKLKDGTRQFLVKWKGFSAKKNTWEPEANLNCPELIEKFMEIENMREESTRETREVRKQVHRYNPELTKRRSHRSSAVKRVSYHELDGDAM